MTVTIHRPVYTGTGYRATNGSGLALTLEQEVESLEQAIYDVVTDIRAVLGGPGSTITQQLAQATATGDTTLQYARAALVITIASAAGMATGGFPGALSAAIDTALTLAAVDVAAGQLAQPAGYQVAQIGSGATPVTPVTPPPAGYGGSTPQEVWEYPITDWPWIGGTGELNALDLLQAGGVWGLLNIGSVGIPDRRNPYFALVALNHQERWTEQGDLWTGAGYNRVPAVDWTQWDGEETLVAFLNRVQATYTFAYTDPASEASSSVAWAPYDQERELYWRCLVTDELLPLVSGLGFASSASPAGAAPVWPGIAAVTLGEAVAFNDVIEVEGPMDGVLIAYTTPPSKVSIYNFGSYTAYGRAGQLAFVSDNGQVEEEQWLQFSQALYTPKAMSRAASCLVRPIAGQEGTITPWTVT